MQCCSRLEGDIVTYREMFHLPDDASEYMLPRCNIHLSILYVIYKVNMSLLLIVQCFIFRNCSTLIVNVCHISQVKIYLLQVGDMFHLSCLCTLQYDVLTEGEMFCASGLSVILRQYSISVTGGEMFCLSGLSVILREYSISITDGEICLASIYILLREHMYLLQILRTYSEPVEAGPRQR